MTPTREVEEHWEEEATFGMPGKKKKSIEKKKGGKVVAAHFEEKGER